MVVLDILKEIKPICISEKLGLYIKNPNTKTIYNYVRNFIEDEYYSNLQNDKNFRKKMISYFEDDFYKDNFPKNINRLNSKQLISMISKKTIILEIETSPNTILIDDEVFDLYEEDKISEALQKRPLLNPFDEYEIEYKILFLFNLLRDSDSKRDELDMLFSTSYFDEFHNTFDFRNIFMKTKKSFSEHEFKGYKYYNHIEEEYNKKIGNFIEFGKKLDNFLSDAEDYFKIDFIIEMILSSKNTFYSLLNYSAIIEMLIVNPTQSIREQFKQKIKFFTNTNDFDIPEEIEKFSTKLYDIRSRLIHGNYNSLKEELKDFQIKYMKTAEYDLGEFKEINWNLISVNISLSNIVRSILTKMLENKKKLNDFKHDIIDNI